MIINVGNEGGGIIVWNTDDHNGEAPPGDETMLWIDVKNLNIPKFWNGSAWVVVPAVWT